MLSSPFWQLLLFVYYVGCCCCVSAFVWPELDPDHPGFLPATSRCGLVNKISKSSFSHMNEENGHRLGYHYGNDDFVSFVENELEDNDAVKITLDYCIFRGHGGEDDDDDSKTLQIDSLCDDHWNCVCNAYYNGLKCNSCTFCAFENGESRTFPYPLTHITADCTNMNNAYPGCSIQCKGDLLETPPSCGLHTSIESPAGAFVGDSGLDSSSSSLLVHHFGPISNEIMSIGFGVAVSLFL
mmetsp:Transcript_6656/g.9576  ORF Transcript_6656/g.9576 Transcript_6656/m.9576 type:complete len:240 (-) Transcript_6656:81-800(-)